MHDPISLHGIKAWRLTGHKVFNIKWLPLIIYLFYLGPQLLVAFVWLP